VHINYLCQNYEAVQQQLDNVTNAKHKNQNYVKKSHLLEVFYFKILLPYFVDEVLGICEVCSFQLHILPLQVQEKAQLSILHEMYVLVRSLQSTFHTA